MTPSCGPTTMTLGGLTASGTAGVLKNILSTPATWPLSSFFDIQEPFVIFRNNCQMMPPMVYPRAIPQFFSQKSATLVKRGSHQSPPQQQWEPETMVSLDFVDNFQCVFRPFPKSDQLFHAVLVINALRRYVGFQPKI